MEFMAVRFTALLTVLGCVLLLAGCASGRPAGTKGPMMSDGACMVFADALKTLQPGDELPRVVEVLGKPVHAYRVKAPFGRSYDVLEYTTGSTPCARMVLQAPKKLEVVFDGYGKMVGVGKTGFKKLQAASAVRVFGIPANPQDFVTP